MKGALRRNYGRLVEDINKRMQNNSIHSEDQALLHDVRKHDVLDIEFFWYVIKQILHAHSCWIWDLYTLGKIIFHSAAPRGLLLTSSVVKHLFKAKTTTTIFLLFFIQKSRDIL